MHIRKPLPEELPSRSKLWLSSAFAVLVAATLIVTVIIPAERGIDPTGIGERLHLKRMGLLKIALAEQDAPIQGRPQQIHSVTLKLAPGQGKEVKIEMKKGYTADYYWQSQGGPVYHDTHGDIYASSSVYVSYSIADNVNNDQGTIDAIFGGYHGWYWENRGDRMVAITLQTEGEYIRIKKPNQ